MIDPSMVTDWTSQPYSMPAAVGSFNPFALRGAGLLTEGTGMMPASTVPLYPARVVRSTSSGGGGGGGGGFGGIFSNQRSGGFGSNFSFGDPGNYGYSDPMDQNSYTGGLVGTLFGGQLAAPVRGTFDPSVDMSGYAIGSDGSAASGYGVDSWAGGMDAYAGSDIDAGDRGE
jgi:hypothetical protein